MTAEDRNKEKAEEKDNDAIDSVEDTQLEPVEVGSLPEFEIEQAEKQVDLAKEEYGASDSNPDVVSVRDRIEDVKTSLEPDDEDKESDRQADKEDK